MCRQLFVVLTALAMASCAAGCRSTPPVPEPAITADTWAVVDGRTITRDEVENAYRRSGDVSQPLSDEEVLTAKLTLLNDLIVQEILLARARDLKIELSDSELDTAYGEARKNMPEEAFQQELTRRKITAADLREGLRRDLLTQKVIDREVGSKIAVTDQEVTAFFNANRAQFNLPEDAYHLAQIIVTPVGDPQLSNRTGDDAATPQAASAKAAMLMERLKGGASFADLAMDYSEDAESAPRGGDLGLVPVSRLKQAPPSLRNAVLNKSPGTIGVVSEGGGHTILLVVAHQTAGQRDLSAPEVRDSITERLRARKEQLLRAAYLTTVRTDAKVVNYLARRLVESPSAMPAFGPVTPGGK